ncbi:MAG: hypothetical protein ACXWEA_04900 [Solirubrobacterales bacterium]
MTGDEQGLKRLPSRLQTNRESFSLEAKVKVGVLSVVRAPGPPVIEVWGGVASCPERAGDATRAAGAAPAAIKPMMSNARRIALTG